MSGLIERHEKNNWTLSLWDDGVLFIVGIFKTKVSPMHVIQFGEPVCNLPKYVVQMVEEMYDAHRDECRAPLSMRIDAYRQRQLPKVHGEYSGYNQAEMAGEYYKTFSQRGLA